MKTIVLKNQTTEGETLQATFAPEKGLNLISFKKGSTEVIEQTTWNLFDERYAGLGALIGPHFHRRRQESLPKIKDETLFPHIATIKAKGVQDPFSHGIARYAPWTVEATSTSLKGILSGKDTWNDIPLSSLESQNFKMEFKADLQPSGLLLNLSIVSDTDSLVGIHYYYALPGSRGRLITHVQDHVRIQGKQQSIPSEWALDNQNKLVFDLSQEADFTFRPYPNPLQGDILLETDRYALRTRYTCACEENCWQLYHPANAPFVCIEPISSQDPRHPHLSISELQIHLEIINP